MVMPICWIASYALVKRLSATAKDRKCGYYLSQFRSAPSPERLFHAAGVAHDSEVVLSDLPVEDGLLGTSGKPRLRSAHGFPDHLE